MKALVLEQWQGGHYFNYLGVLVPALASFADEVVVGISPRAAASPRFASQLGHLATIPNVRVEPMLPLPEGLGGFAFRKALGDNVFAAVRTERPDYVLLPSGDEQLITLPLLDAVDGRRALGPVHVEMLLHYPAFTKNGSQRHAVGSAVQRVLAGRPTLTRIGFVNFVQHAGVAALGDAWTRKTYVAGDPVPPPLAIGKADARRLLGLDDTGAWIGMIGELSARKAVSETVAAFRRAALPPSTRLLLAGLLDPGHAEWIRAHADDLVREGRLVVLDRFLSDRELLAAFAAIDLQCAVYRGFEGLSSLLLKGVAAGASTIASDAGWCGETVRRFRLGWSVAPADTDRFAEILRTATTTNPPPRDDRAVERLLAFHSIDNFAANVLEPAGRLAGRPLPPPLRWTDVLPAPDRRRDDPA